MNLNTTKVSIVLTTLLFTSMTLAETITCTKNINLGEGYRVTFTAKTNRTVIAKLIHVRKGINTSLICNIPKPCVDTQYSTCGSNGKNSQVLYSCYSSRDKNYFVNLNLDGTRLLVDINGQNDFAQLGCRI